MSGMLPSSLASAFVFEVTVTLTIAGVTRAARASIALSTESSGAMLSSSSAAAAGVGLTTAADAGLASSYAPIPTAIAAASTGTMIRRVNLVIRFSVAEFISVVLLEVRSVVLNN
jgi:hypothetical protein